jgi:hypothetical protein
MRLPGVAERFLAILKTILDGSASGTRQGAWANGDLISITD